MLEWRQGRYVYFIGLCSLANITSQQINTWLKNQTTKANTVTKNPFRTFLAQSLKNLAATKPAHVPEYKMWMKQPEYREAFEPIFHERWAKAGLSSEHELTQRVQAAQDVYDEQDEEVRVSEAE